MSDEEVIRKIQQGDKQLFDILMERYRRKIQLLAWRMLGNQADGEDLAQEIFLKVYNKIDKFNFLSQFSTWLYRVALNACYDYLRKKRLCITDIALENLDLSVPGPEKHFESQSSLKMINQAINRLPAKSRAIIILRLYQDLNYQEIGEILKIKPETAKMRYYRARLKLQDELKNIFLPN